MRRTWVWITGSLIAVLAIVLGLSFFIDEPLRTSLERKLNDRLLGYTVRLGAAHLYLFGFSVELKDLVIKQETNPDPPVATIPKLTASVQWHALLSGRVVADFELTQPVITINRKQTVKENEDNVPVQERGWQEALQSIYPVKINELRIADGDFTYVDEQLQGPYKLWVHTHRFSEDNGETTIEDEVQYRLPFPPIGEFVYLIVRTQLQRIFHYRQQAVQTHLHTKAIEQSIVGHRSEVTRRE